MRSASALRFSKGCSSLNLERIFAAVRFRGLVEEDKAKAVAVAVVEAEPGYAVLLRMASAVVAEKLVARVRELWEKRN